MGDVSLLDRESLEDELMPDANSDCKGAEEGTACYKSVTWLRQEGFSKNPDWYQGYSSESTFEEVQDMLYGLGKANCPKPCLGPSPLALFKNQPKFDCRDTIKGDVCYASVTFLKEVGLELHPDWFPELHADSSMSTIQAELHRMGKADCPLPCALTDEDKRNALWDMKHADELKQAGCNDALPGTQCYNDVTYGMSEGIKNYPWMYEGLTEASTFHTVQEHLYLNNRSFCDRPCPEKLLDLDLLAKHPEQFREKKRVQDMSIKELNDYFNGDWDGYVAREFRAQDYQAGEYQKAKYSTSTTIRPEEAMSLPMVVEESTETASHAPEEVANATGVDAEMADAATQQSASASTQGSELNLTEATAPPQVDSDPVYEPALNVSEEPAEAEPALNVTEEEEEASLPKEETIPETYQVLLVRTCLKKLYEVTPENFDELRRECEVVMEEAYDGGEAHEALSKEAMSYFVWAQRRVEQIRDERKAKEAQAAESAQQMVDVVDEPMPSVEPAGEEHVMKTIAVETQPHVETPEEMEQRIRRELLDEMRQARTPPTRRETEDEMRQRLRAELMR